MAKQWNPAEFNAFANELLEQFGKKGVSVEALIKEQMDKAKDNGYELNEHEAYEEVIADACERMLLDSDAVQKMAAYKAKNPSRWQQIVDAITEFIDNIRKLFVGAEPDSEEAALYKELDAAVKEHLENKFVKMVMDAGEHMSTIKNAFGKDTVVEVNENGEFAFKDKKLGAEDKKKLADLRKGEKMSMPKVSQAYTEYSEPITEADIATLRTIGRESVNSFTSEDIQKAQKWAYKFYESMQKKSPFFRSWFGEWRSNSRDLVTVVREKSVGKLANGRAKNRDVGIEMSWNAHDIISETTNHAARDRISIKAINQIAEIVENAILLDTVVSMPTSKSKMKNTAFMHSFYSVYNAGTETYIIKLYAEMALNNRGDTVFTRAYQLKDIKKVAVLDNGVLGGKPPLSDANTTTIKSIADLVEAVKKYDPDYSPKATSKIVNADGTPKVMYHGTKAENGEFNIFDESKAVRKGGLGFKALGKGNYFTATKLDGTERYGSRVVAAYLDIKTPFIYAGGMTFHKQVSNSLGIAAESMSFDEIQTAMRNAGYDGVIQYDKSGDVQLAVTFDSNQIKSVDNIGTFDGGNLDIRYKRPNTRGISSRQLLADAFDELVQTPKERELMDQYRANITKVEEVQERLRKLRGEISRLTKAKGDKAKINNKIYDILKWIAQVALPAIGTLYFALAGIWGSLMVRRSSAPLPRWMLSWVFCWASAPLSTIRKIHKETGAFILCEAPCFLLKF